MAFIFLLLVEEHQKNKSFQFDQLLFYSDKHGAIKCKPIPVPEEPNHRIFSAKGRFGSLCFHEFNCKDFDVLYGQHVISDDINLSVTSSLPFLGMIFNLSDIKFTIKGLPTETNRRGLCSILYIPQISVTSMLKKNTMYEFMSVGFRDRKQIFQFKSIGQSISEFTGNMRRNIPCYANPAFRLITYDMTCIINKTIGLDRRPELKSHYINSLMHQLLNHVIDTTHNFAEQHVISKAEQDQIEMVHNHIIANLSDPGSLHDLTLLAGMNTNKLSSLFKRYYKKTIFAYLRDRRMEMAQKLIRDPGMNIQTIAETLGYRSSAHFAVEFKKVFGLPPSKFR